jgi:hypothetical protein
MRQSAGAFCFYFKVIVKVQPMWPWNGPRRRIGALVVVGNGFGCRLMSIKVERLGLR